MRRIEATGDRVPPRLTVRQFTFIAGLTLWLGSMLVQTGASGIVAFWTASLLVLGLALVTAVSRTVTMRELIAPFCLGGAMIAFAIFAGAIFDVEFGTGRSAARALGIPAVEEALKIAPVLFLIWRARNGRGLTFGICDVLVLAVASGAGFGLVEDAFIRHSHSWGDALWWLPTSEITGDRHGTYLVIGHGPMAAITGLALAFALAFARSRMHVLVLLSTGWLLAVVDHARNNYMNYHRDGLSATLNFLTANSYLTAYLLVLGLFAAIAVDVYYAYVALPRTQQTRLPPLPTSWRQLIEAVRYLRLRNRFAYAVAQRDRKGRTARASAAAVAAGLDADLSRWWSARSGALRQVSA